MDEEMVQGYRDGYEVGAVPPGPNRSASYRHGWLNGRDDRQRQPRATAAELRRMADNCVRMDRLAGITKEPET